MPEARHDINSLPSTGGIPRAYSSILEGGRSRGPRDGSDSPVAGQGLMRGRAPVLRPWRTRRIRRRKGADAGGTGLPEMPVHDVVAWVIGSVQTIAVVGVLHLRHPSRRRSCPGWVLAGRGTPYTLHGVCPDWLRMAPALRTVPDYRQRRTNVGHGNEWVLAGQATTLAVPSPSRAVLSPLSPVAHGTTCTVGRSFREVHVSSVNSSRPRCGEHRTDLELKPKS